MAPRRKSLLNAFKEVSGKQAEPPRVQPVETPRTPPRAAPPRSEARAENAIPVRVAPPSPPARRPGTHADLPSAPPPISRGRLLLLAIIGATVLLGVMVVKRFGTSGDEPREPVAYAGDTRRAANDPPTSNPPPVDVPKVKTPVLDPAAGTTDEDRAFADKKNRFTLRLAQYENDENGLKLSRATYKYLRGEEVPIVQPILSGDGRHIFLCADAKAKKDELIVLRDYVQRLRGPDGRSYPFRDAYIDNIENLLKR